MSNELITSNATIKSILGCAANRFKLPTASGKIIYVVPLSGGLDSFCTALVLLYLFPDAPFSYIFSNTGVEVDGTEQALDTFERITGKRILRIEPKLDLLEACEANGNYIPSNLSRWCTQTLKTLPIGRVYKKLLEIHGEDTHIFQFVGIRADEPTRKGVEWSNSHIGTVFPLQQLGLVKSDVNRIVRSTEIGIPSYYSYKSRSGCFLCINSRRTEVINAWERSSELMIRAANTECLPPQVISVYCHLPETVSRIVNMSRNWLTFYRPSRLNAPKMAYEIDRKISRNTKLNALFDDDLFGSYSNKSLFVAIEYQYKSHVGGLGSGMVYFEKIITYSTSMSGIKKALKFHWLHRLQVKEMFFKSESELREDRQIQIVEIEIDNFAQEIPPKPEGGYTWQSDKQPLYAIRKAKAVIERILLQEGLKQDSFSSDKGVRQNAKVALSKLVGQKQYGRILNSIEYHKPLLSDLVEDIDIESEPVMCMSCSR